MDGLSVALLTGDTAFTVEQAWQHVKALRPAADRDTRRSAWKAVYFRRRQGGRPL